MDLIESTKLQWNEFNNSVSVNPLNSFYMRQSSDSYGINGYSFYIKSPAQDALLDPEAYIRYKIRIQETGAYTLSNKFNDPATPGLNPLPANVSAYAPRPGIIGKIAFRQGNIMQRATQSLTITMNGYSFNSEPWKYVDALNRLYVSQKQSKHIFSGSGGNFDDGNHGLLTKNDNYYWGDAAAGLPASLAGSRLKIFDAYQFSIPTAAGATGTNENTGAAIANTTGYTSQAVFPNHEEFYNSGFSDRVYKFSRLLRGFQRGDVTTGQGVPSTDPAAALAYTGNGTVAGGAANQNYFEFEIWEPIAIPPFKMYDKDPVIGMIPNLKDLSIRAAFSPNFAGIILQGNMADIADIYWTGLTSSDCEIYLKWFTPPATVTIPKEITIHFRKIDIYSTPYTGLAPAAGAHRSNAMAVSQYNISLDAVPDYLLIFLRQRLETSTFLMPSDYFMEIQNLQINLENQSGKLTQISTYQLYKLWLKACKHEDPENMGYDEWRRYCCVAILKPEDYGIVKGPGFDNSITLGVKFDAYNYHNNPRVGRMALEERFVSTDFELVICSIYDKWSLTLSQNGTANAQLTRVRSLIAQTPPVATPVLTNTYEPKIGISGLIR